MKLIAVASSAVGVEVPGAGAGVGDSDGAAVGADVSWSPVDGLTVGCALETVGKRVTSLVKEDDVSTGSGTGTDGPSVGENVGIIEGLPAGESVGISKG